MAGERTELRYSRQVPKSTRPLAAAVDGLPDSIGERISSRTATGPVHQMRRHGGCAGVGTAGGINAGGIAAGGHACVRRRAARRHRHGPCDAGAAQPSAAEQARRPPAARPRPGDAPDFGEPGSQPLCLPDDAAARDRACHHLGKAPAPRSGGEAARRAVEERVRAAAWAGGGGRFAARGHRGGAVAVHAEPRGRDLQRPRADARPLALRPASRNCRRARSSGSTAAGRSAWGRGCEPATAASNGGRDGNTGSTR